MTGGRASGEAVELHGRSFMLGHWYEYGEDHLPAQFLGVIHSTTRICSAEEWVDRAGDEVAALDAA